MKDGLIAICSQLSLDVYRAPGEDDAACELRFRHQHGHRGSIAWIHELSTDTHCVVIFGKDYTFCGFRGTESFKVAMIDADCLVTDQGWHDGFDRAWKSVCERVLNLVSFCVPPLVLWGHSAGGAIAVRAQWDLKPAHIRTFGQPPVGVGRVVDNIRNCCLSWIRGVNYLDIVPRSIIFLPHRGDVIEWDGHGRPHWNPGWHWRLALWIRGLWRAAIKHRDELLRDHHAATYARLGASF
jgi:hypothetical protein